MKHERQTNWIRYYGRPSTAGASVRRAAGGDSRRARPTAGRHPEIADQLRIATEAVGLGRTPSRYRTVLVPLDGELFAEHALPFALGIARRTGAEVRLVHVHCPLQSSHRPETLYYDVGLDAWNSRRQQVYLNDLVRRLAKVTSVPVTPVFVQGQEVVESLGEAASAGADLVVMATHRRGLLGRLWYGSVADVLMQQLCVPLLLVQGYNAPADLTGDPRMRKILIPLDGSKFAEQVIEPALTLVGNLTDADHTMLRVVPLKANGSVGDDTAVQRPLGDRAAEAQAYLSHLADRLGRRMPRVHPRIVLDARPIPQAILESAQVHDADVIALATRWRGGLSRLFRGSTADRVVRGTSMPVLVYRPNS